MKVLITGANGLLGVNVVRYFAKANHNVRAMVRPSANLKGLQGVPCEVYRGDICTYDDVFKALYDCDAVVHAASTTSVVPRDFDYFKQINVLSTQHLINAALAQGNKRFVHVSTANAFDPGSKDQPGSETSKFTMDRFGSGYITSKHMAQRCVLESVEKSGLNAVVVNPTFIIGPYDIKPSSGKIILQGLKRGVQWCPPGGKNFVHVKDVAKGIHNAMHTGRNGQCYLLAGENLSYVEFFSLLNQITGKNPMQLKVPKAVIKLAGTVGEYWNRIMDQRQAFNKTNAQLICLDNYYTGEKANRELNLSPTPVSTAIMEAIAWFKKENYISSDNYSTHGTNFDL